MKAGCTCSRADRLRGADGVARLTGIAVRPNIGCALGLCGAPPHLQAANAAGNKAERTGSRKDRMRG